MLTQEKFEELLEELVSKDWKVRAAAAYDFGKAGDTRAVEPLIKARKDRSTVVRWHIAVALGEICDIRAVEPLIEMIKKEDKIDIIEAARFALDKIKMNHKKILNRMRH